MPEPGMTRNRREQQPANGPGHVGTASGVSISFAQQRQIQVTDGLCDLRPISHRVLTAR